MNNYFDYFIYISIRSIIQILTIVIIDYIFIENISIKFPKYLTVTKEKKLTIKGEKSAQLYLFIHE